jgi:ABC-type uncharacterized transport system auxiliary subunit
MRSWSRLLPAFAAALLAACSGLKSDAVVPVTYLLRAPTDVTAAVAPVAPRADATGPAAHGGALTGMALRVERVVAPPGFDTDRILVLREPRVLDYYAGSRWSGALPDMLGTLAVDTLRATGAFTAVHDSSAALASDYTVRIVIRRYEADATVGGAPLVHVVLDVTVGRRADRGVVASFVAEGEARADAERMRSVVAAFDAATSAALRRVATQTVEAVVADVKSH